MRKSPTKIQIRWKRSIMRSCWKNWNSGKQCAIGQDRSNIKNVPQAQSPRHRTILQRSTNRTAPELSLSLMWWFCQFGEPTILISTGLNAPFCRFAVSPRHHYYFRFLVCSSMSGVTSGRYHKVLFPLCLAFFAPAFRRFL